MCIAVIEGVVVEGRKLGRKLGFPTANIILSGDCDIQNGVYLSIVMIEGVSWRAVTNIGINPTIGGVSRRAESHILDFDGDIYGVEIKVELVERLRAEINFESVEALRAQVERDINSVRSNNNNI